MKTNKKLKVKGMQISLFQKNKDDYISLTDIAFEFASWISLEFKLYLIKEFQRLKEAENQRLSLDWNIKRELAKVNYKIHTDAIKQGMEPNQRLLNLNRIAIEQMRSILNHPALKKLR